MTNQAKSNTAPMESDVQSVLKRLATRAMGLTGADVERIVREARQVARRKKRPIRYKDLEDGIRHPDEQACVAPRSALALRRA